MLYPTGTNDFLGSEKWGAGPTGLVLKQTGGWTYGVLFNQIWSYAGNDHRNYVSSTFLQPFISYTTKTKTTFAINTESTYDWHNSQWTVPDQSFHQPADQGRQAAGEPGPGRENLRQWAQWRARLGNSLRCHPTFPDRQAEAGACRRNIRQIKSLIRQPDKEPNSIGKPYDFITNIKIRDRTLARLHCLAPNAQSVRRLDQRVARSIAPA